MNKIFLLVMKSRLCFNDAMKAHTLSLGRLFRPVSLAAQLCLATAWPLASLHGQVAVYRMDFKETGSSLNYDFYTGGYFVCDLPEGTGTFIFTIEENTRKLYTTSTNSGSLFVVKDGSIRMAAIGATGGTGNANSALLVTGSTFDSTNIGGGTRMPVVKSLSGTFLAYTQDGSTTTTNDTTTSLSATSGLAGFAKASFSLDSSLTRHANADLLTVSEAVDLVVADLVRRGFTEEDNTDTNDTVSVSTTGS